MWPAEVVVPRLFHIQSIGDVELFGINGGNCGRYVLDTGTDREHERSPDLEHGGQPHQYHPGQLAGARRQPGVRAAPERSFGATRCPLNRRGSYNPAADLYYAGGE